MPGRRCDRTLLRRVLLKDDPMEEKPFGICWAGVELRGSSKAIISSSARGRGFLLGVSLEGAGQEGQRIVENILTLAGANP